MLSSLYVRNYALISELKINFHEGFNAITGETGAGKSIILGALSLILGQKVDSKALLDNKEKCIVEAVFHFKEESDWYKFFVENEFDFDFGLECIIRREITPQGRSRAFVNDTPVSLQVLKTISDHLLDIHSQHENLMIVHPYFQLEVLDTVASNGVQLNRYQEQFNTWRFLVQKLATLKEEAQKSAEEIEYIKFQYNQLEEAKLVDDELELLEDELKTMTHADEIRMSLEGLLSNFEKDDAVLAQLKAAIYTLSKIKEFVSQGGEWFNRLNSAYIELKDLASDFQTKLETVSVDPLRLAYVENRVSELYSLLQKFRAQTISELIIKRDEFLTQLRQFESYDEAIAAEESTLALIQENLMDKTRELTNSRVVHSDKVKEHLTSQLQNLGIPNVRIEIEFSKSKELTQWGGDKVRFMFSANKNRELQDLRTVASGGEISRIMLSIKALTARTANLPAIIFDEVDTGVSGETANQMGNLMSQMAKNMQVITITHLPQIAAKATHHYRVFKTDTDKHSFTSIAELDYNERKIEIATMLSGSSGRELAIKMAEELLSKN